MLQSEANVGPIQPVWPVCLSIFKPRRAQEEQE